MLCCYRPDPPGVMKASDLSTAAPATGTGAAGAKNNNSWVSEAGGAAVMLTQAGLWTSLVTEVSARFRHGLVIWGRHLEDSQVRYHVVSRQAGKQVCFISFYFYFLSFN